MTDEPMGSGRLETFCDGVIAIIITIMVLELKVPHGKDPALFFAQWPLLVSYVLSFLVVATFWVNHHHLMHFVRHVNTPLLWSTIGWLFFMSLVPFTTGYMTENEFTPFATAVYGSSLLLLELAYIPVFQAVAHLRRSDPAFTAQARRARGKLIFSLVLHAAAIPLAYVHPALTLGVNFLLGFLYFVPGAWWEKRI
jgi:uncharacterized membrane protein